jgi:hypothetical protein
VTRPDRAGQAQILCEKRTRQGSNLRSVVVTRCVLCEDVADVPVGHADRPRDVRDGGVRSLRADTRNGRGRLRCGPSRVSARHPHPRGSFGGRVSW